MKWLRMTSVKNKIVLIFSLVFLLMLAGLILLNKIFMVDFFIMVNKERMFTAVHAFEDAARDGDPNRAADEAARNSGGELLLFDREGRPMLKPPQEVQFETLNRTELTRLREIAELHRDNMYFEVLRHGDLKDDQMLMVKVLKSGETLILAKKMGLAGEVMGLNLLFILLTAIVIYVIALVLTRFVALWMTQPIEEMREKAEKMARLDFSEKINVSSHDEIGRLSSSINTLSDELSNVIKVLNLELEKEKKLEQMRRRFVSDVSHELKNPISMILSYADGLRHNIPKTEEKRNYYYQVIVEESARMNRLIKDLLDLSSYESGTFMLKIETVDFSQIVRDYLEMLSHLMQKKNLHVTIDIIEDCLVEGDSLRLGQVVDNLLINAIKYANENGTVKVVLFREDSGRAVLKIQNTGSMIPEKELDQIWNSFYQVDSTSQGHGLGLAIVKSILQLHRGSCRAYIEEEFNTFEIILP